MSIPPLHQGHELFDQAMALCADTPTPGFASLTHPYHDDLISEVVLALIEGLDPKKAKADFLRSERVWRRRVIQECKWEVR